MLQQDLSSDSANFCHIIPLLHSVKRATCQFYDFTFAFRVLHELAPSYIIHLCSVTPFLLVLGSVPCGL